MTAALAAAAPPARPLLGLAVERRELGGGCVLLLVRDDAVPLVHLHLALDAGADREAAGREGLASASLELLALPAERAALEERGSDLLARAGWTSASLAIEALADEVPAALDVFEASLARDVCDAEALPRWVGRRLASLAAIEGAAPALADLALARILCGGRREGLPLAGTRRSLGALTPADVIAFRRAVRRRPWTLTAVGSFDAEPLARRVAGWPWAAGERAVVAPFAPSRATGLLVDVPAAQRTEVRLGSAVVGGADLAGLRLFARLVAARLHGELRDHGGLTYDVRARLRRRRAVSLWSVAAAVEPEAVERTVAAIEATIADVAATAPPEAEIAAARRAYLAAKLIGRESLGGLAAAVGRSQAADDELDGVEEASGEDLRRLATGLAADLRLAVAGPAQRLRGSWRDGMESIVPARLLDGQPAGEVA